MTDVRGGPTSSALAPLDDEIVAAIEAWNVPETAPAIIRAGHRRHIAAASPDRRRRGRQHSGVLAWQRHRRAGKSISSETERNGARLPDYAPDDGD